MPIRRTAPARASDGARPAREAPRLRRAERAAIVGALLWLLVGPRVQLPGAAGLRVEDLVFVVLAVLCAVRFRALPRPDAPSIALFGVVGSSLLSTVVTSLEDTVHPLTSAMFALRPFEYWVVYPAVRLLLLQRPRAWRWRLDGVLAAVTVLQSAFAVAQYCFRLEWGFSHAAYTRAAGLTVGPYELGAISGALLVYWASRRRWVLAGIAAVGLLTSISRISALGATIALGLLAVTAVLRRVREVRSRRDGGSAAAAAPTSRRRVQVVRLAALLAAGALGLAGAGLLASPGGQAVAGPIASRFATTSLIGSWNAAGERARQVPPLATADDYSGAAYSELQSYVNAGDANESGAEPSNLVRFYRWHLILSSIDTPLDLLFGLGPSFTGPSVDGSYLRFLADGGLVGVAAWLLLLLACVRRMPVWMVSVVVGFLVGAVFIDILFAERPMVLFWALLAMAATERQVAIGPPRHSHRLTPQERLARLRHRDGPVAARRRAGDGVPAEAAVTAG